METVTATPGIYKPVGLDTFELCLPVNKDDYETITEEVDGTVRGHSWSPIHVQIVREDCGRRLQPSDSPFLGSRALIFRRTAIDAVGALLLKYGELLPLVCPEAELYIYNPRVLPGALDEEASSIVRYKSGKLMMIDRHVFRATVVAGVDIFKITDLRPSTTFVSERFLDLWSRCGLKGLEFKQLWTPPA